MALRATSPDLRNPPKENKNPKNKTKQKEGLGPSEVEKRKTKPKNNKKQKKRNKERKSKKHNNTKKSFSVISQIFLFWGVSKIPFLTTWPRKRAPKNTLKIGVSARHFWKNSYASRNSHFRTKNQIQKFQLSFLGLFSSLSTTKTQKSVDTPIFTVF